MSSMFKKIIFVTGLLNINNIRCSEKELNEIKEKINKIYDNNKEPLELYIKAKNIKNYDVNKDKIDIQNINNTNQISDILNINITKKNGYFHFLKTSQLLKIYLLGLTDNLNNLNEESMNILEKFIKLNYSNFNDTNINFDEIKQKVEEIYFYFIKTGLNNIRKKIKGENFTEFVDKEFDYIKDDYFKTIQPEQTLNKNYKFLENFKNELYKNLKGTQEACTIKFIISDDLEPSKYCPKCGSALTAEQKCANGHSAEIPKERPWGVSCPGTAVANEG